MPCAVNSPGCAKASQHTTCPGAEAGHPGPAEAAREPARAAHGRRAWLTRYRLLTIRYERLPGTHRAFLHLACALVCWNYVLRL
jgi:hypothetical protein